jgi:hypothetical protein
VARRERHRDQPAEGVADDGRSTARARPHDDADVLDLDVEAEIDAALDARASAAALVLEDETPAIGEAREGGEEVLVVGGRPAVQDNHGGPSAGPIS